MPFFDFDFDKTVNEGDFVPTQIEGAPNQGMLDVLVKQVEFAQPQMGMFDSLIVTKKNDDSVWLEFLSKKYAPNKKLMDFMAYCTDKWGLDSEQQGYPSPNDTDRLERGYFRRIWPNIAIYQTKRDGCFSLTITLIIIINNPDMSNFTKQLAKGFIRSAVNQVGRDGGRVISNNIYNGQNYVPVADATAQTPPPVNPSQAGLPQGAQSTTKHFSAGKMVWLSILSIFIIPFGSIGVFLYGLFMLIDRTDKVTWESTERCYVSDRRYKTGSRYVGDMTQKHSTKINASPEILEIKKRNAKIAMIIGGIGIAFFTLIVLLN